MELGSQRNRDNLENVCRSLGSDYHPSGQSRKISIGIMAEEQLKKRAGARKEDEVAVKNIKKGASGPKVVEENNRKSEIVAQIKEKQAEGSRQKTSPWISTNSFSPQIPTTRTVQFYAKQTSVLDAEDGLQKKFNRVSRTPKSEVVQLYAKQSMILQSSNGVQKKFDGIAYGRRKEKGGNTERVEEFAFAAAQEVHMSDNGVGEENKENRVNQNGDSLRQKLWEALETVPSQNEKNADLEEGTENLSPEEELNHKSSAGVKRKQNSDTIETDSESPNANSKRPVTRSLSRKKFSTASCSKSKHGINNGENLRTNLSYSLRHQEKNIFTFNEAEERSGSLHRTSNSSLTKKSERKYNRVEPRRFSFSGRKNSEKKRQGTDKGERPLAANKTPSHSSRVEKSHSDPSENNREHLKWPHEIKKDERHHSSENKKGSQQEDLSSPESPKCSPPQEDLWSDSLKKKANPQDGVDSPTLEMKAAIKESFFDPKSPKSIQMNRDMQSPVPDERRVATNGFYNLRTRQKSNRGSSIFNAQTDSSDDSEDPNESPTRGSSPVMKANDAHKSSQSSEDQEQEIPKEDQQSPEEDQPIRKGFRSMRMGTAGSDNPEESPLIIRPSKRIRHNGLSCLSPSKKGTEDINELLQPSDQNQDGLTRAVALFALALERFKTRMHTQTSKKSTEILASLSEEIQSQLQNVDSQIQKDASKFTNFGKSMSKILEKRLQEQQEQLKFIKDKFDEEVAQHMKECNSTFEDFKAIQLELKGDAKRQNASHQKLLLQVEEAFETQLSDADRRITAIQKVSREKMSQLRRVITECLKEGVFD